MKFEIIVRDLHNGKDARVELPNSNYINELTEIFGEEWIEHDYEIVDVEDELNIFSRFRLYGFESLDKLNKLAERINESCSDTHTLKVLESASEVYSGIEEVLELIESDALVLYENQEIDDLAEMFVDEGAFGEINEKLLMYIDYEKLGRDIMLEGNYYETKNGLLEEVR
ncbi:antirestriction protein ArdA [Sulfurimonas sp.]|uniref:antirestriction protein ArdA n=1 Tax=Sulfurimonas sp. TaxID=2022749 RepID=UPI003D0C2F54